MTYNYDEMTPYQIEQNAELWAYSLELEPDGIETELDLWWSAVYHIVLANDLEQVICNGPETVHWVASKMVSEWADDFEDIPDVVSMSCLAETLKITEWRVYRACKAGKIKFSKVSRKIEVDVSSAVEFFLQDLIEAVQ